MSCYPDKERLASFISKPEFGKAYSHWITTSLLYDVTSTFFEGSADFPMAQRGYHATSRSDCKQVCPWSGGVALRPAARLRSVSRNTATSVTVEEQMRNSWSSGMEKSTHLGSWTEANGQ